MSELIVPQRFCGPPGSGNGGWSAGALADLEDLECPGASDGAWPTIEVSLRMPPPLDTPMDVRTGDDTWTASHEGADVLVARRTDAALVEVDGVDHPTAVAASAGYPGLTFHPFPTCFSCGTGREEGDGLRIFPGAVAEAPTPRVAAPWTPCDTVNEDRHTYADPDRRASVAATWAALDCVGGWAGDLTERLMVLGRMTARLDTLPIIGEEHVVVGEPRGQEGRKTFTASTLYDSDGRVVATAEHIWITVDPSLFGGVTP